MVSFQALHSPELVVFVYGFALWIPLDSPDGSGLRCPVKRVFLVCVVAVAAGFVRVPSATAACSSGVQIYDSCSGFTSHGCCTSDKRAVWCEGGVLCASDCSNDPLCGWSSADSKYECGTSWGHSDPSGTYPQDCTKTPPCKSCGKILEVGCCTSAVLNWCQDGCLMKINCGTNATGYDTCGWAEYDDGSSFYDCGGSGADPTGAAPKSCSAVGTCKPACTGKECGSDGCGGSCGSCAAGENCTGGLCVGSSGTCGSSTATCSGHCGSTLSHHGCYCDDSCTDQGDCCDDYADCCPAGTACTPQCDYVDCGADGCGGSCGSCDFGDTCENGFCVTSGSPGCTPYCLMSDCGDDGCGGSCGTCAVGQSCSYGFCSGGGSYGDCTGKQCGSDGAGGTCGICLSGSTCQSGTCVPDVGCTPVCSGKSCGADGCGGYCGTCLPGTACQNSQCVTVSCTPDCSGRQCGDNGCGGSCGTCGAGKTCQTGGQCGQGGLCTPQCGTRECGSDGCDGVCGTCMPPKKCAAEGGMCFDPTNCTRNCDGRSCGDDSCGGTCGTCPEGDTCNTGLCSSATTDGDATAPGEGLVSPCPVGKVLYYGTCRAPAVAPGKSSGGCNAGAGGAPFATLIPAFSALFLALRRRKNV